MHVNEPVSHPYKVAQMCRPRAQSEACLQAPSARGERSVYAHLLQPRWFALYG